MRMRRTPTGSARRVRGALAEEGVSGAEIARRLGFTQSYVARRLCGDVEFRVSELEAIARELDVPLSRLVPGDPTEVAR